MAGKMVGGDCIKGLEEGRRFVGVSRSFCVRAFRRDNLSSSPSLISTLLHPQFDSIFAYLPVFTQRTHPFPQERRYPAHALTYAHAAPFPVYTKPLSLTTSTLPPPSSPDSPSHAHTSQPPPHREPSSSPPSTALSPTSPISLSSHPKTKTKPPHAKTHPTSSQP